MTLIDSLIIEITKAQLGNVTLDFLMEGVRVELDAFSILSKKEYYFENKVWKIYKIL